MKLSTTLLNRYFSKKLFPEQIAEALTEHSFEVELVTQSSAGFENIVAAKVLDVQKHPNADRLRVVKLGTGSGIADPVVCGAFNFGVGDMVALALPGAHIPHNIHSEAHEPFTLGKAKIRGIESRGMICAAFELGLSAEIGDGVMVLASSVKPGTPLSQIFGNTKTALQASAPANRADLHSHWGIARELAAVLKINFKEPKTGGPAKFKNLSNLKVKIADKNLCSEYIGIKLTEVSVKPSSKEVILILEEAGMKPINNVVDITNLAMMVYGQPLHAFDAQKVEGNIVVRRAVKGEILTAINHKQYNLRENTAVIADSRKALAIAGIMGGLESEVKETTSEIILESAHFNPESIRRTGQALGLRSEASALFEKNPSAPLTEMAAGFAVGLLQKYAGAQIEAIASAGSGNHKEPTIKFNPDEINELLGTKFSAAAIVASLKRYGIGIKSAVKFLAAVPPWWRMDLKTMPDLAEEVLKIAGYNKIKPQQLSLTVPVLKSSSFNSSDIYETKNFWARLGYNEVQNYSFVSEKDIKNFGETRPHIAIANPLSEDQRFLKRHLLIPVLKNVSLNAKSFEKFKLVEIGKQYLGFEDEPLLLTSVVFDKSAEPEKLLAEARGDALSYLNNLGVKGVQFEFSDKLWVEIKVNGQIVGMVGIIENTILENFDIDYPVAFAKLELEKVLSLKKDKVFSEINKFPKVERDLSIILSAATKWDEVKKTIKSVKLDSGVALSVSLFEAPYLAIEKSTKDYHKKLQNEDLKNLGIRLIFENFERTLTEAEVAGFLNKIVLQLVQQLKAKIR